MDSVINDPYMVKHICNFLEYDDKKTFTLISKIIYNASKLVYHDFIFDIKRFNNLTYANLLALYITLLIIVNSFLSSHSKKLHICFTIFGSFIAESIILIINISVIFL